MRFVLQRVKHASVKVDGELIGLDRPWIYGADGRQRHRHGGNHRQNGG